jgi:antitoxin (DNA-binding transcriptional repressor) of toxin-antitoxin stability system
MKTVSKGKLKDQMLEYFSEVERTGEPLIVTDHGREVLEVRPVAQKGIVTAEEVVAWYQAGSGPGLVPDEAELLKSEPVEDWEALRDENRDQCNRYPHTHLVARRNSNSIGTGD